MGFGTKEKNADSFCSNLFCDFVSHKKKMPLLATGINVENLFILSNDEVSSVYGGGLCECFKSDTNALSKNHLSLLWKRSYAMVTREHCAMQCCGMTQDAHRYRYNSQLYAC